MKCKEYIYLIICFLFVFSCKKVFSQEKGVLITPNISIISSDAFFIDTIVTKSNNKHIPGSKRALHVVTYYKYLSFNFRISLVIKEKGNIIPMPLNVRITSPKNVSQVYSLEKDISILNLEETYEFNFNIWVNESGWFLIELISNDNLLDKEDTEMHFVFDKTQVYFKS